MTEMKPTSFKNGVPKAERNGMFGAEEQLAEIAKSGGAVLAIVAYSVLKVIHDEIADERYPVVQIDHIEPLFSAEQAQAAQVLREAAYKARTGGEALDFTPVEEGDE